MAVTPLVAYPTAEDVMNMARAYVNDAFQGGRGRILTDQNPFTVQFLNSALQYLQDKIRNRGVITLYYDNIILTPILPVAEATPGLQQQIAYQGFFDGTIWHDTPALPGNCVSVIDLWERQTGSGLPFQPMKQMRPIQDGFQGPRLIHWEYRQDAIILLGATVSADLRLRMQGQSRADRASHGRESAFECFNRNPVQRKLSGARRGLFLRARAGSASCGSDAGRCEGTHQSDHQSLHAARSTRTPAPKRIRSEKHRRRELAVVGSR